MSLNNSARSGGISGIIFFDFLTFEGILCVLIRLEAILMSTHNIHVHTQYTFFNIYCIYNIERKSPEIILKLQLCFFFEGIQERD